MFGDWRITYRELESLIYKTAHYLRALDIGPGDCVAIISRNCPEFIVAEMAILKLGATVVKFNWRLAPEEMSYLLKLNDVKCAFLKPEKQEWGSQLKEKYRGKIHFIDITPPCDDKTILYSLLQDMPDTPIETEVPLDSAAYHMHTSGTTGRPKCVVYAHAHYLNQLECMMETLELGVQRSLTDMNIDTIDVSYFERWKKVYEEEMDCWSNWIFPIFTSCFCVVLSKNIKEEQSNLKKNDAKEVSIMYKELSDYINKNNLKMSAMTFDDELLSNARKNSIMRNMISDYLMDALQEKRRLPIPITLKEVNEIMPKRSVGKGLKEARI